MICIARTGATSIPRDRREERQQKTRNLPPQEKDSGYQLKFNPKDLTPMTCSTISLNPQGPIL
jgi:hypothetical protein